MQLSAVYQKLSYGVLSNVAIGGDGSGTVPEAQKPRLLGLISNALTELYTRFILLEKEVLVRVQYDRTVYPLLKVHALSDATVGYDKFILDNGTYPFVEDVLRILGAFDEAGCAQSLNDPNDSAGIFTVSYNTIQVPYPTTGDSVVMIYQADHPRLLIGDDTQDVLIPEPLFPALEHRVAYKIFSAMSGSEASAKATEHLTLYENVCATMAADDMLLTSQTSDSDKLCERGFP